MDAIVDQIALELLKKSQTIPDGHRFLIGLSGIPASGKSSLSHAIINKLNSLYREESSTDEDVAIMIGLDGWHLTRATLAAMPNKEEAFARRGAHWTFSGEGYLKFVQDLKSGQDVVFAPSFSHATKDPVEDDIRVDSHHKVVMIEGLYVFLAIEPWKTAGELLDERWFVEVDIQDAKERIVKRHVETGVTSTTELAIQRAEENDFPNGEFVIANMLIPTRRFKSVHNASIAI